MFEFTPLDGMGRLLMLKKQKETVAYWKQLHKLKGAFLAWGRATSDVMRDYKATGGVSDVTEAIAKAGLKGEITVGRLENQLNRVNEYLKQMDTYLADGSKWYNALEIQEMYDAIEQSEGDNAH